MLLNITKYGIIITGIIIILKIGTALLNNLYKTIIKSGSNILRRRHGFTITEVLIALLAVAVLAVLIIPVITTRAQNRSFAVGYESELKQMLGSLEGLPASENRGDITGTMMYVSEDTGKYGNTSGAYINKYMKVSKYCGDRPGDCFGSEYYQYTNNERTTFDIGSIKGACALLKNGVSICLKPQIKKDDPKKEVIEGWIDLNGPTGPNVYGRDLRTFSINLKQRGVFNSEDGGVVTIPTPNPNPCEGDTCEPDPCDLDMYGRECCTKAGRILDPDNNTDDFVCCKWYRVESDDPNYLKCNPSPEPPDLDCANHTITGPDDICCKDPYNVEDPKCCTSDNTSDYCCSLPSNKNGVACCKKRIESASDMSVFKQNDACCAHLEIKSAYDFCKSVCEADYDGEECCKDPSRREAIDNPDDACCEYGGVNGLETSSGNTANKNEYCCRLPENDSDMCCRWKYDNIGKSKDFYAQHDYNKNDGTFDGCCHHSSYGIKSNKDEVLSRCCTVNKAQDDAREDELCCEYLLEKAQVGNDKLLAGKALRRCCKYNKFKNNASKYPQCCSNVKDGEFAHSSDFSEVCCMPNSMYDRTDVAPNKQCCLVDVQGEDGIWGGSREQCCSFTDLNDKKAWQVNCCSSGLGKYPSITSFNENCCSVNAKRTKWVNNDCCSTLLQEKPSNNGLTTWKTNCCHMPDKYGTNTEYRKNCCKTRATDYTRLNGSTVKNELEHCCHPDAPQPAKECCEIFKGNAPSTDPDKWLGREDEEISDAYKTYCCKEHGVCPNSCKIKIAAGKGLPECCYDDAVYNKLSSDSDLQKLWKPNCCSNKVNFSNSTESNKYYAQYKLYCCKSGNTGTATNGKDVWDDTSNCCSFTSGMAPSDKCCNIGLSSRDSNTLVWSSAYVGLQSACCNLNNKYCSCAQLDANEETLSSACCVSLAQGGGSGNGGKGTGALSENWKTHCCSSANKGENATDANWLTKSDFKSYCCSPSSSNSTGNVKGSSTKNYGICCDKYEYGKGCCKDNGVMWDGSEEADCCDPNSTNPTQYCCENSKYGAKDAAYCCETYKTEDLCDSCELRLEYKPDILFNEKSCCYDNAVLNAIKTDSALRLRWQKACCGNSSHNGANSDLVSNSLSSYKAYCCASGNTGIAGDNNGHSWSDKSRCCTITGNATATTVCCSYGQDNNWDSTFQERCCASNCTYCTCDQQFKSSSCGDSWKNATCCPELMSSYKGNSTYKDKVLSGCCPGNKGGLPTYGGNSSDYATYCCETPLTGHIKGGNSWDNDNVCCDITTYASDFCCGFSDNWVGTKCCSTTNGKDFQNNDNSKCCTWTNTGTGGAWAPDHCCSSAENTTQYFTPSWKNGCCNKSSYRASSSECCKWRYDNNKWDRPKKDVTSSGTEDCCYGGYLSGQKWLDGCCSAKYLESASGSRQGTEISGDYAQCCLKIRDKNGEFPPGNCCQALGVDASTGKDASGKYYEECHSVCIDSNTFGGGEGKIYNATENAKKCCGSGVSGGLGLAASQSGWYSYCCGMKSGSNAWQYDGTGYYEAENGKCCAVRKRGSGSSTIWGYDPYYLEADGRCPAGGEKNKCSSYYNPSLGFYCGPSDLCKAWQYHGDSAGLSDSDKLSCCNGWGNNPPDTMKTTCCELNTSLSYCDKCADFDYANATFGDACCSDDRYKDKFRCKCQLSSNGKFTEATNVSCCASAIVGGGSEYSNAWSDVCCNKIKNDSSTSGLVNNPTYKQKCDACADFDYANATFGDACCSDDRYKDKFKCKCKLNSSGKFTEATDVSCCAAAILGGGAEYSNAWSDVCCNKIKNDSSTSGLVNQQSYKNKCPETSCVCTIPSNISNITTETNADCCLSLVSAPAGCWNSVCCSMCSNSTYRNNSKYAPVIQKCGCGSSSGGGSSTSSVGIASCSWHPSSGVALSCGFAPPDVSPGNLPDNIYASIVCVYGCSDTLGYTISMYRKMGCSGTNCSIPGSYGTNYSSCPVNYTKSNGVYCTFSHVGYFAIVKWDNQTSNIQAIKTGPCNQSSCKLTYP